MMGSRWTTTNSLIILAIAIQANGFSIKSSSSKTYLSPRYSVKTKPTTSSSEVLPVLDISKDNVNDKIGLYVHIPYCRRRCRYCNFSIVPIGSKVQTEFHENNNNKDELLDTATKGFLAMDQSYRQVLLQEIDLIRRQQHHGTPIMLQSIYFGGGTPSLAPLDTIQTILNALLLPLEDNDDNDDNNNNTLPLFQLAPFAEVSIEMDPGTFSLQKLYALKEMGFNRISLGVQSFHNDILESIGRVHRYQDVVDAVTMIDQVFGGSTEGKDDNDQDHTMINYSIDLISGLPGLSLALWTETLAMAVALKPQPTHISLYDLQIEQGTVFGNWYGRGEDDDDDDDQSSVSQQTRGNPPVSTRGILPSPEDCAFMYKYAAGYLGAKGYEHYEVSSYALRSSSGSRSRNNRSQHNQIYWAVDGQWYALGLGSTSFVQGEMMARPKTLVDYQEWVQQRTIRSSPPLLREHEKDNATKMDPMDFLTDVIMKRLRTCDGLDLSWIRQHYGQDTVDAVLRGAALGLDMGLMTVLEEEEEGEDYNANQEPPTTIQRLCMVDPDGFLYSNTLISSIFLGLEEFADD